MLGFDLGDNALVWVLLAWTLPWKGYALWVASKKRQKWWFIALLIINTAALLEMAYIFYFSKRAGTGSGAENVVNHDNPVSFQDFQKLDIKIGRIVTSEPVSGSDKLLKLGVDTGELRTIVAGIGKEYSAEELADKHILVVCNLEPKKLMGIESQGMLLAASDKGKPVLVHPDKPVDIGSRVT